MPSHFEQEPKGGFPYLLWGVARWSAMPHGGRSTKWECSHRFITFGLYIHIFPFLFIFFIFFFVLSLNIFIPNDISFQFNDFADRRSTKPKLSLVNKASLDRVLKAEIYVNKTDGQLWAAYLILSYTPLSFAFQAPKCVIKACDPQLHCINVAYQGFIILEGVPLPKDTSRTKPFFVATISTGASSSQLALREEEVEEKEEEERKKGRRGRKSRGSCRTIRLLGRFWDF